MHIIVICANYKWTTEGMGCKCVAIVYLCNNRVSLIFQCTVLFGASLLRFIKARQVHGRVEYWIHTQWALAISSPWANTQGLVNYAPFAKPNVHWSVPKNIPCSAHDAAALSLAIWPCMYNALYDKVQWCTMLLITTDQRNIWKWKAMQLPR